MNISCHFIEIVAIDAPLIIITMAPQLLIVVLHLLAVTVAAPNHRVHPPCHVPSQQNTHISMQKLLMMKLHFVIVD
jgi:hypothetical protein